MNKRRTVMSLAAIAILVLAAFPLAAQSSQTDTATSGLFGNDVDDFLSTTGYGDVEFDSWFSYLGWSGSNLSVGYARRFGGLYGALNYTGNILETEDPNSTSGGRFSTKTNSAVWDSLGVNTQTTTSEYNEDPWADSRNDVDLLLGIAGMGIKLGFAENLRITDNPTGTINSITEYPGNTFAQHRNIVDTYRNIDGWLTPSLGWGMNLDLGGMTLSPSVAVNFTIYQDELLDIRKSFDTLDGSVQGEEVSVVTYVTPTSSSPEPAENARFENYLFPYITLGADLVLKDDGVVEIDAGLEYSIGLRLYNNSFDVFGVTGSTTGTIPNLQGTHRLTQRTYGAAEYQYVSAAFTEQTYMVHYITPSFTYYQNLTDAVQIGFDITPAFSIGSSKILSWDETTEREYAAPSYQGANRASRVTVTTTDKDETNSTFFGITPAISAGVTYALVPNRFVVNAGLGASIEYTTISATIKPAGPGRIVTTVTDEEGNETKTVDYTGATFPVTYNDYVLTQSNWSGLSGTASAGFTLYFTPKFLLDTSFDVSAGTNVVDLTKVSVLFSLKN